MVNARILGTMGLFSSVVHVRDKSRDAVISAIDEIVGSFGFSRTETIPVTTQGPFALPNHDGSVSAGPYYLISPLKRDWLTIVEAHLAPNEEGVPDSYSLANGLSAALSCLTLTLIVHDDDLFLYSLDRNGQQLDGYNSCPQYFEQQRLSEEAIAEQRHAPEAFEPLLPAGHSVEQLRALLNRGWWNAHDSNALDEDGVAQGEYDGFVFEGERMTAFGTFLQLHGTQGEYPYAAWGQADSIAWLEFIALRYRQT